MKATMMPLRLPYTLRRTALMAQSGFAASIRNRQQVAARRSYAEAHLHDRKKGNAPWYDDVRFRSNVEDINVLTVWGQAIYLRGFNSPGSILSV